MRSWPQGCWQSVVRWTPGGVSGDIEDRRDSGPGFGGYGPHLGIGGFIILGILSLLFHRNLFTMFTGGSETESPSSSAEPGRRVSPSPNDPKGKEVQFVSSVLDDVQHTWETLLP